MKRFTIVITLLGIAIMSFAEISETIHQDVKDFVTVTHDDAKTAITTIYQDGKDAASTLYPEIKDAIISIGKAIGVAAEHVYTVLVKNLVVLTGYIPEGTRYAIEDGEICAHKMILNI